MSFNCSGQRSYDVGIPEYLNCYDQSRIGFFNGIGCKPDTCSTDLSFMDLRGNDLDFIYDEPMYDEPTLKVNYYRWSS